MIPKLGNWHVHVREDWANSNRELFIWVDKGIGGGRSFVQELILQDVPDGTAASDIKPAITDYRSQILDHTDFLQKIFDECWRIGMRPQDFKDKTDELSAVRYHLEDMRALAIQKAPTV